MNCPACGEENRAGRRFCRRCGSALALICVACGAANEPGDEFCGECGSALQSTPPRTASAIIPPAALPQQSASPAPPRLAERRHVSVLFADLVGFTSLSNQRDAEDVRELLSEYFATARTVISRYGGIVEKFIGDAVMAVWGATSAQEDDAERAVRAALELVDAVAAFGESVKAPELQARAAVLTGEAAVNVGAVGEGMVAGDLVNAASRAQSVAEPGTVVAGDATKSATDAAIEYEDIGSREVKGRQEPLHLWRARRVVANRGGVMRPTTLEPPFVGREREYRLLKEMLHATSEEGKARLLSVVGTPGIGKSRLAWEFEKYVDGLTQRLWWHRGRCLAYGEGVAYWALAEMVRRRAGIVENEPPTDARRKLRTTVEQFIEGDEDRQWVENRLSHLLGLDDAPVHDAKELYAAWRFFFERLAAQSVVVLVFEDLQWADAGLLDFIEYLLEWSRSSPILILTLARPEVAQRRPDWGVGKRGLTSMYLEPLAAEAMEQLLDGIVPGLPRDVRDRILDRAAGIPLYAVETVRMLIDRNLLVQEDGGGYRLAGSADALEVPESLHALIASRLDSLPPAERSLLQDAAVMGKSFSAAGLSAVSDQELEHIQPLLSSLVAKDLLALQSDPRSPERGQYVFVQDLVRSVARDTLSRHDRKARHLAAAAYLESAWSDEEDIADVVASHLTEAYEADRDAPDAAEIRARARDALVRAGDHAAALASAAGAQRHYERALELAESSSTQAELHSRAGAMALMRARPDDARRHFEAALRFWEQTADTHRAARVAVELARVDNMEGRIDRAIDRMEDVLRALAPESSMVRDDDADVAAVAAELGRNLVLSGRSEAALPHLERALRIADPWALTDVCIDALTSKGSLLALHERRIVEGEALVERAYRMALDSNLGSAAMRACNNLSALLQSAGRFDESLALAEEGRRLSQRLGDDSWLGWFEAGVCTPLVRLGRWDEALALVAAVTETGDAPYRAPSDLVERAVEGISVLVGRGQTGAARALFEATPMIKAATWEERAAAASAWSALLLAEGNTQEARTVMERVLGEPSIGELFSSSFGDVLFFQAAEAFFATGDDDAVRRLVDRVHAIASPATKPNLTAHAARFEARLAAQGDDGAAAERMWREAITGYDGMHTPFWAATARVELAEWLAGQAADGEWRDIAEQAQETFVRLKAAPWAQRTERLLAASPVSAVAQ